MGMHLTQNEQVWLMGAAPLHYLRFTSTHRKKEMKNGKKKFINTKKKNEMCRHFRIVNVQALFIVAIGQTACRLVGEIFLGIQGRDDIFSWFGV